MIKSKKILMDIEIPMERMAQVGIIIFLAGFYLMVLGKFHNKIFFLLILIPGLFLLYKNYKEALNNKILFYFGLFLFYYVISSLWGDNKDFFRALKYSIYIITFMWVFSYFIYKYKLFKNIILHGLPLVASISVIVNALFWYSEHPISSRLYGTVGIWECIGLGVSFGLAGLIALNNIITAPNNNQKYFNLLMLALLCVGVILSQSKLALGSMLGGAFVLIIIHPTKLKTKFLVFSIAISLFISLYIFYPQLLSRHLVLFNQLLANTSEIPRVQIWHNLLLKMNDYWLFGHGYGVKLNNFVSRLNGTYSTAHNVYIGHLYLGGLVGIIFTLVALSFVGICCLKNSVKEKNNLSLSLFTFSILVMTGQYTILLDHPNEVWINILVPLSISYGLSINKVNP